MAIVIAPSKSKEFKFKIGDGKTYTLPPFSKFPLQRALKQSGMTSDQIGADYMAYVVEQCPEIAEDPNIDIMVLGQIVREWQLDSGIELGE